MPIEIGAIVVGIVVQHVVGQIINKAMPSDQGAFVLDTRNLGSYLDLLQRSLSNSTEVIINHHLLHQDLRSLKATLIATTDGFSRYMLNTRDINLFINARNEAIKMYAKTRVLIDEIVSLPDRLEEIWDKRENSSQICLKFVALNLLQGVCSLDMLVLAAEAKDDNVTDTMKNRCIEYHDLIVYLCNSILRNACQDFSARDRHVVYMSKMQHGKVETLLKTLLEISGRKSTLCIVKDLDPMKIEMHRKHYGAYIKYKSPNPAPLAMVGTLVIGDLSAGQYISDYAPPSIIVRRNVLLVDNGSNPGFIAPGRLHLG